MERIGETKGGTGRSGSGELGIVRSILASEKFMVLTRDDGGSELIICKRERKGKGGQKQDQLKREHQQDLKLIIFLGHEKQKS